MVSPHKLKYVNKLSVPDCVEVILSFLFHTFSEYKATLIREINGIIKAGYNRNRVDKIFYRLWNLPEYDCFWVHEYVEHGKKITITNLNCVHCGNYEAPFKPFSALNMSITCICNEFMELA